MKYVFTHLLGTFAIDEKVEKAVLLKGEDENTTKKLLPLPQEKKRTVLLLLKKKEYYSELSSRNLPLTREAIRNAVSNDSLIIQTISSIGELDQVCNLLSKRLREWWGLCLPELSEHITNHEHFAELITSKTKKELQTEFSITATMGADLEHYHLDEMIRLAKQIQQLYKLRQNQDFYLQKVMHEHCPNLLELAGATIGARLLELGKGLKHLATLPASTIQLLGAEKALFRHIKTGARAPKYGVLFQHPLVQNASKDQKGKAARLLADKLSLCARLDYFKGEFKAPEYKKEVEGKIK
ncbi:NOP58 family protein [Candidatus Woesearchaeota archaeon]|nr:NOP58 family protein [Candidatus Woesearchaeota archaeon]